MPEVRTEPEPRSRSRGKIRRDRRFAISAAAIGLFLEQGLEATTVDEIAAEAGVAPRTFFRHFATKVDAVFPDHDEKIEEVRAKLGERHGDPDPMLAVLEVTRGSALQYLEDPELYRPRFKLILGDATIRDRERLLDFNYVEAMAGYLEVEMGDRPAAAMRVQALSAAVVAASNFAIHRWAEAPEAGAEEVLARELRTMEQVFAPTRNGAVVSAPDAITITIPASVELQRALAAAIERARDEDAPDSGRRRHA